MAATSFLSFSWLNQLQERTKQVSLLLSALLRQNTVPKKHQLEPTLDT